MARRGRHSSEPQPAHGRGWLLRRYWPFSWSVLAAAVPLLIIAGGRLDLVAVVVYAGITTSAFATSLKSPRFSVTAHLLAMFPYWTWYSGLAGGLPQRLGTGVAEYVIMLIFPLLTLVTIGSWSAAGAAYLLGAAGLFYRWNDWMLRGEGLFLLGTGAIIGLVFRALAQDLERALERTRKLAYRDELTELSNRREVAEYAERWLAEGDARGALVFIDMDRFTTINDALGHGVGDLLLRETAERLQKLVGRSDVVARVGGDEFAVMLRARDHEAAALALAEKISRSFDTPFDSGETTFHATATVGIALWPEHGRDFETLLKSADAVIARARREGQRVAVHTSDRDSSTLANRALEVELQQAIRNEDFCLEYQPIVDLSRGVVVGAEALVRWNHPTRGRLAPGVFIPVAEETGQIAAIDAFALREAAAQLAKWNRGGFPAWVSVNLSARSLKDDSVISAIEQAIRRHDLGAGQLTIEVTESAAMHDPEQSRKRLARIVDAGAKVAIDDFGMGYSSLSYLKGFPADHLKLDRGFVDGIGRDPRDEHLIDLVLQLATRWKLGVVAEGVENLEQLSWLTEHGCRFAQGFFLARPMDASALLERSHALDTRIAELALPKLPRDSDDRVSHADVSGQLGRLRDSSTPDAPPGMGGGGVA